MFTSGGLVFVVSMLPTLLNSRAAVPPATSLPTGLALLAFSVASASLGLPGGALMNALTGVAWLFVAARRRT